MIILSSINCSLLLSLSNLSLLLPSLTVSLKPKPQFLTLLIKTFKCRVIDIKRFLQIIDAGHIRYFVVHYKRYIKLTISYIDFLEKLDNIHRCVPIAFIKLRVIIIKYVYV